MVPGALAAVVLAAAAGAEPAWSRPQVLSGSAGTNARVVTNARGDGAVSWEAGPSRCTPTHCPLLRFRVLPARRGALQPAPGRRSRGGALALAARVADPPAAGRLPRRREPRRRCVGRRRRSRGLGARARRCAGPADGGPRVGGARTCQARTPRAIRRARVRSSPSGRRRAESPPRRRARACNPPSRPFRAARSSSGPESAWSPRWSPRGRARPARRSAARRRSSRDRARGPRPAAPRRPARRRSARNGSRSRPACTRRGSGPARR